VLVAIPNKIGVRCRLKETVERERKQSSEPSLWAHVARQKTSLVIVYSRTF